MTTEENFALFGDPSALAPQRMSREDRPDGSFVLRHPEALQPFARCIGDWLEHWAALTPDAPFLSERDATGPVAPPELPPDPRGWWAGSRRR